jgi:hypothetical protein
VANRTYDRIEFTCGKCHRLGVITAVLLNLTDVVLEGGCPECKSASSPYSVNRAQVDRWLKDEVDSPDLPTN